MTGARSGALVRWAVGSAALLSCFGAPAGAVTLARGGRALATIVVADGATAAERRAASELAHYLGRAAGAEFRVRGEAELAPGPEVEIHVGPTRAAQAAGFDPLAFGPDEWWMRVRGSRVLLAGGRPRGALYAAYRFLEEGVGVRFFAHDAEHVPRRRELRVARVERRGAPAFAVRDIHYVDGPPEFRARLRLNGSASSIPPELGGMHGYGPPHRAHTFYAYVPPGELFAEHPEYFSEIDGERQGARAQLCLTNRELVPLVAGRMRAYVEQARREAHARGAAPPLLYGLSQNDWGAPCECSACAALAAREGSEAGPLIAFVNAVADEIASDHPEVLVDTLAYHYSFEPPRALTARPNVVVHLSALQWRDFSKPVTDARNAEYRAALAGWAARTSHLRIWDYSVTFGAGADLPLGNLETVATDLRAYRDSGVEGLFYQHESPGIADFYDLKLWVMARLFDEPEREVAPLVREFARGYYGRAARPIRRYLAALRRAMARHPAEIGYPADADDHAWLDLELVRRGQARFERAERRVADDPVLRHRVRVARSSLDRALLARLPELWEEWNRRGRRGSNGLPDPERVARRFLETLRREAYRRLGPAEARSVVERDERMVERALRGPDAG